MNFFLKASVLVMLFSSLGLAIADEKSSPAKESEPANSAKETALPENPPEVPPLISLDDVIKQVMLDTKNKVLAAKTEVTAGKKIYLIKVLTSTGHIQHLKINAATGKPQDEPKK